MTDSTSGGQDGSNQLRQNPVVQISPFQFQNLSTSTQSLTGFTTGDHPSVTQPVAGIDTSRPSSTPPQLETMQWALVHTVPQPPARPDTPQVYFQKQDSVSHMSQMSVPLFTEDKYSSDDQAACDREVNNITRRCTPSDFTTIVVSPRPGSTSTVDYSTQGDPDQPAQELHKFLTLEQQWIENYHNYLLPDGTRRTIFDIPSHKLHFSPLFARKWQ